MEPFNALQIALKNNLGVYYFQTLVPLYVLLDEKASLSESLYENIWNSSTSESIEFQIPSFPMDYVSRLSRNGILALSGSGFGSESEKFYAISSDSSVLVLKITKDLSSLHLIAKSVSTPLLPLLKESIQGILLNTQ